MSPLWVMLGAAGLVGLLVYGLVREGRRLMSRRAGVFRSFASRRDWKYRVKDDGRVREILEDLPEPDGYTSASDHPPVPHNVIQGDVDEGRVLMFEHVFRTRDGVDLPLHVVLLETDEPFLRNLAIRTGDAPGLDPSGPPRPQENPKGAPGDTPESLRRTLRERLDRLPWPVDLQVQGCFVAVYAANEGALSRAREMDQLLEATRAVAQKLNETLDEEPTRGRT